MTVQADRARRPGRVSLPVGMMFNPGAVLQQRLSGFRSLRSSNCTWRNGVRIAEPVPIEAGDTVLFGKGAFKVVAD